MIVLNNKITKEAMAHAVKSGRVTAKSCPHAFLLQALIHLNYLFDVNKNPRLFLPLDFSLDNWNEVEIVAADTISWLFAFLERIGCKDIEQLLRDVSSYRMRHPDIPTGTWPYTKVSR